VLGLDFAQFLLGAKIDGAEPLAVAPKLFKLGLNDRELGQGRIGLKTGQRGQRFWLSLQDFSDLGGEVQQPALYRLMALLCTRTGFARCRQCFECGASRAVSEREPIFAFGQPTGCFTARALRARNLIHQDAALAFEQLRRVHQAFMLGFRPGETYLDRGDLGCGAVAARPPIRGFRIDRNQAALRQLKLAGERLDFGAHLGEPSAIVRYPNAGLSQPRFELGRRRQSRSSLRGRGASGIGFSHPRGEPCLCFEQCGAARYDAVELAFGGSMPVTGGISRALQVAPARSRRILAIAGRCDFRLGGRDGFASDVKIGAHNA
jgi:hypothetical protein